MFLSAFRSLRASRFFQLLGPVLETLFTAFDYLRLHYRALALAAFALLCLVTGFSVAYALGWSAWLGLLLGLVSGAPCACLPWLQRCFNPGFAVDARRYAEVISLIYLVFISVALLLQTLPPLLGDAPVRVLALAPLLLMTAALYATYMILHRLRRASEHDHGDDGFSVVFPAPPGVLVLAMAVVLAIYTLLLLHYVGLNHPQWQSITVRFLGRGIIPPLTLLLFFWGILLLANRWWVLWREQLLLEHPEHKRNSILTSAWRRVVKRHGAGSAGHFLEIIWKKSVDFYTIPRYINWAIPILGFIGTVLGISLAADGIQKIINTQSSVSQLSEELGQAIAPLGIAFDTTLIALSLSVFLMLLQTILQRWEDNILIDYESRIRAGDNAAN